jgi:hypothetical protein
VIRECAPQAQDCTHRDKDRIDEVERAKNRTKSTVRSKVEHVFGVMKLKYRIRFSFASRALRIFTVFLELSHEAPRAILYLPLGGFMQGDIERWQVLCKQAMTEEDPEKLMELIREINLDLEAKENRVRSRGSQTASI